ncbi:MAG: hypothetical protein ACK58H_05245 [Planctomyces sp.]
MSKTRGTGGRTWAPPKQTPAKPQEAELASVADEVVEEVPAACPRCHSTDRDGYEGSLVRQISGMSRDGRPFNRIRWQYCTCRGCGQRYRVIRRENVTG